MKGNWKTITLEDYIEFLENPHGHELTISHLNQIIYIHGFKKLYHDHRADVVDTLNSMDLFYPNRSTLKQNVSCGTSLSTEEVIKDLDLLDWKECTLRSIETISSSGSVEVTTRFNSTTSTPPPYYNNRNRRGQLSSVKTNNGNGGVGVKKTGQRSGKRKKMSLKVLSSAAAAVAAAAPSSGSSPSTNDSGDSSYWLCNQ
ncbi:hypothetical protein AQUCO_00300521v1 [Aquilegia coerulea]|uniref:DUF7787 domain-containing protein n=1 Tax=Aquilegia coerulea TaxID=218851 RepID=A0A2G5EZ64_AQUCA|nr:hypothetical protein AQUCO_00300521v1 [Aquilegia coerulea]